MITSPIFYLFLSLVAVVLIVISFHGKKTFNRDKSILSGTIPQEAQSTDEEVKGKSKQQAELELLLINTNPVLVFLGMIDKNLKVKFLAMFLCAGLYYLFNRDSTLNDMAIPIAVILALVILLPSILTNTILKSRIKRIMVDIPGFIDLVAVNVQTGITIDAALKQVATDFKKLNPDLTHVMLRIIRKGELTGLSAALQELAISLPTTEIRMFCTVLQQSINFGSSIYPQLIQLSSDIRELQLLNIEERLGTLSAKMSVPLILFIMFPIIILILAPGIMRVSALM